MKKIKVGTVISDGKVWICTPYIMRNGKPVYPKNSKVFCFWANPKNK